MSEEPRTLLKPVSPYPALLIESGSEKFLTISDIHLGWEANLAGEGVHVPSQTNKLLRRLERIISLVKPDCLTILGDIKHTIEKIELEEWRDVPIFFESLLRKISCIKVIPGNHDGNIEVLLPEGVEVAPQQGIVIGGAGLFHGHTWPDIKLLGCETLIIGHIHPTVTFKDPMGFRITSQVWVRAPCDRPTLVRSTLKHYNVRLKRDDDPEEILRAKFSIEPKVRSLIVMPSFNDFLGGRAINRASISRDVIFKDFIGPVLRSGSVDLERAEIYLLDGTFIGTLNKLSMLE
ncbi:MAG: metallophosphoesterase [Candidatus Bathyarchaeia archaeon]|nr:metallophosphoesterase [Candidatus Bathyarchaeota archaeon]